MDLFANISGQPSDPAGYRQPKKQGSPAAGQRRRRPQQVPARRLQIQRMLHRLLTSHAQSSQAQPSFQAAVGRLQSVRRA